MFAVNFMSRDICFCPDKLNFLQSKFPRPLHKIAFRIRLLRASNAFAFEWNSFTNASSLDKRYIESIQSFPKLHLIIAKDIEIYSPKLDICWHDGLIFEQCNKIVICKLKVCNYIWRCCARDVDRMGGECNRCFQLRNFRGFQRIPVDSALNSSLFQSKL